MRIFPSVIFIPADEQEAICYLLVLTESEPELSVILKRDCPRDCTAISKLQHLVTIGACEEMSAAQNEAFEEEIVRYELDSQKYKRE